MVYLEKVGTDPFIIKQSPDTDCVNATRHIVFPGIYFYRLQADFLYIEIAGLRIQCHTGNIETVVTCRHLPADAGLLQRRNYGNTTNHASLPKPNQPGSRLPGN